MKLNLGCGFLKMEGFVNIDNNPEAKPDKLLDITKKLPFNDDSVEFVRLGHILEHIESKYYIPLFEEIYRVLKKGGKVKVICPYPISVAFPSDPTHITMVVPATIESILCDGARKTDHYRRYPKVWFKTVKLKYHKKLPLPAKFLMIFASLINYWELDLEKVEK
jgi:ubiquinone/menaquinone biosynthesis C-methylase UbiE